MSRKLQKRSRKKGLPPGSLFHVGEISGDISIRVMDFTSESFSEKKINSLSEALKYKKNDTVSWIDISGVHDAALISQIGDTFGIHSLILEDIMNTNHRPGFQEMDNYALISMKMVYLRSCSEIVTEQLSLLVFDGLVISFQELPEGDILDPVRERIRNQRSRIRKMPAGYLAYSLMDVVIDNYFSIIDDFESRISFIEEQLIRNPAPETLKSIHQLREDLISFRRMISPVRELTGAVMRSDSGLFSGETAIFLKDIYDHIVHALEISELFRETVSGLTDIYLSSINLRLSEVMQTLTMISTVFIPLSFIAGIYGMNFDFMPELHWKYGYPAVISVMGFCLLGMLIFFRRKRWL